MQILGLILGIFSICIWLVATIPFIGWLNWLNIPLAAVGLAFSVAGMAKSRSSQTAGIIGITLCSIAIFFGILRLQACGGII